METIADGYTRKFFEFIEKNISNPYLDIAMICRETGISRSNLYRYLKEVTDMTPKGLIRHMRLDRAVGLMKDTDQGVAEIAICSGFNSPAYFAQCFKAEFGCSPSEYIEIHRHA